MNMGAALNSRGCFRDDLCLGFSVLAFELRRGPAPSQVPVRNWREVQKKNQAFGTEDRKVRRARGATEGRVLAVLLTASRVKERLTFSQICERVGCLRSGGTHALLKKMCFRRQVQSRTEGKRSVYWVEEEGRG